MGEESESLVACPDCGGVVVCAPRCNGPHAAARADYFLPPQERNATRGASPGQLGGLTERRCASPGCGRLRAPGRGVCSVCYAAQQRSGHRRRYLERKAAARQ